MAPRDGDIVKREFKNVYLSDALIDDGDMRLFRALPSNSRHSLGPFVFIDHYRHQSKRGIGDKPHPHAGIEVTSYLLEGGVEHRDSMGFTDRIEAGDAQYINSGRGILHSETPLGGRHGLQLWTSLPPDLKQSAPTYKSIKAAQIPQKSYEGGLLRVLAGRVNNITGVIDYVSPTVLAHISLKAGSSMDLAVDDNQELGLYVLDGAIQVGEDIRAQAGSLIELSLGNSLVVNTPPDAGADVVLLGGAPVEGEIIFAGPFVMNTQEQIRQAQKNYFEGKMGTLDGVPF